MPLSLLPWSHPPLLPWSPLHLKNVLCAGYGIQNVWIYTFFLLRNLANILFCNVIEKSEINHILISLKEGNFAFFNFKTLRKLSTKAHLLDPPGSSSSGCHFCHKIYKGNSENTKEKSGNRIF